MYPDLNPTAPQELQTYRLNKLNEIEVLITGGISIAAFASGVDLPIGIALNGTSVLLSLATAITRRYFKSSP